MHIYIYIYIIRLKTYYHSSKIWTDGINSEVSEIRSTIICILTFYALRFHAKSASLLLRIPYKFPVYSHTRISSLSYTLYHQPITRSSSQKISDQTVNNWQLPHNEHSWALACTGRQTGSHPALSSQAKHKTVNRTICFKWSQLCAHYFLVHSFQLHYMFRATMCPSSGELTVSMRHWYFSPCMVDCLVCWSLSDPNQQTRQPTIQS